MMKKHSKHKIRNMIHTTTEIFLIVMLSITGFGVLMGIFINPTDTNDFVIEIDNPLETYKFDEATNLNQLVIDNKYVVFNNTGFNVTPNNPIEIIINHIDADIANPEDGNDDLVVFEVNNTPGDTVFSIDGFSPTISYVVKRDSVYFTTEIANSTGSISFNDNPTAGDIYSIFWAAGTNNPPVISGEYPLNGSTNVPMSGSPINVYASDPDGNVMQTDIWTNASGTWTQVAGWNVFNADNTNYSRRFLIDVAPIGVWNVQDALHYMGNEGWQSNGIRLFVEDVGCTGEVNFSVTDDWGMTTGYTKYWWSVNVTDAIAWTNRTYHFTIAGIGIPDVQTNDPTNIQEINITFNGLLVNDGGEDCTVWFNWGNTTHPFSHNTTNQTGVDSGTIFNSGIRGNLTPWYDEGDVNEWLYRKKITINPAYVDSTLTNYPLLINDTDSNYVYAKSNGYDFLFTKNDGVTKISHEIERFTYATNELIAWVNISILDEEENTDIYLYWGNSTSTDQSNPAGVWNSSLYTAVYHLNEEAGSGSTVYDSTVNHYDATYMGNLPTWSTNGSRIGYCQYFDGVGDYIRFPVGCYNAVMENGSGGGFTAQTKQYDGIGNGEDPRIGYLDIHDGAGGNDNIRAYYHDDSTNQKFVVSGAANDSTSWEQSKFTHPSGLEEWRYFGYTWNDTNASFVFANMPIVWTRYDVLAGIPDVGTFSTDSFRFGYNFVGGIYGVDYLGWVDEIRVYDTVFNNSWLNTDTYNMRSEDGFITYWDMETQYAETGNVTPGQLYQFCAMVNNTVGINSGEWVMVLTRPYRPTLFAALTENKSTIQLTWTQLDNSGYNTTYIERKANDSMPWVRGMGNEVYNGTELITNDTGLSWGSHYYYQAWSCANWTDNNTEYHQYSIDFDSANNMTNSMPIASNAIPTNNSIVDASTDISVHIIDPDGDAFNYTIETDPLTTISGRPVGMCSEHDNSNGTKTLSINVSHNVTYTWYLNITDGYDWVNNSYSFTSKVFYVDMPTNGSSHYHETVQYLYFSWIQMDRADRYVVVQNNNSYPTIPINGSGNWVRQNSSDNDFNLSWTETSGGYFTIYSWNSTANMYSRNYSDRQGLNIPWGAVATSCFEEGTWIPITFNLEITNEGATQSYWAIGCTNIHLIDIYDIPYGDNTIFIVTADNHRQRIFYYDLEINNFYNYSFYLPLEGDDPGGNGGQGCSLRPYTDSKTVTDPDVDCTINLTYNLEDIIDVQIYNDELYGTYGGWLFVPSDKYTFNTTHVVIDSSFLYANTTMAKVNYYYEYCGDLASVLCQVTVIDEYEQRVPEANVLIRRLNNETGEYINISKDITDGNGQITVWLMQNVNYRFEITKNGYEQLGSKFWIPTDTEYTKTFRIKRLIDEGGSETIWDFVTYTIDPQVYDHYTNFTMFFNLTCNDGILEYFNVVVYFYNETTGVWDVLYTENISTQPNGGSIGYTTTMMGRYGFRCTFKLEDYDEYTFGTPHSDDKHVFTFWPPGGEPGNLDDLLDDTMGKSPVYVGDVVVAWTALIASFVSIFAFFTFSPRLAGLGIMGVAASLAFFKVPLMLMSDDIMNMTAVVTIAVLGLIVFIVVKKRS